MKGRFGERRLAAGALIAVGVLWLLVSSGFIPGRMVGAFWSFWPLLPIGIGLDLLLKQRVVANIPYTALAIAAMLILALLPGTSGAPFKATFSDAIGSAERAEITLDLGPVPTTLTSVSGEVLLTADIVDNAEVVLTRDGDQEARIVLDRRSNQRLFGAPLLRSRWDLELTDAVPLSLVIGGGSGSAALDLGDMQLESLGYDGGSGSATLILPSTPGSYPAEFDLGSGSTEVEIGNDAKLTIRAATGSGSSRWSVGRNTRLDLVLDTGSGSVTIDLPDGDAILLRVEDDGSGRLSVPPFLNRDEGSGERGVWRSGSTGEPRITVTLEDVGSGSVTIR